MDALNTCALYCKFFTSRIVYLMVNQVSQLKAAAQLLAIFYGLTILAWRLLRRYLFNRSSGIPEIENIGKTRLPEQKLDGTALICGGRSVALHKCEGISLSPMHHV